LDVAEGFGLGAQVIGRCERGSGNNSLSIESRLCKFLYD
jgi:hypothetical protein